MSTSTDTEVPGWFREAVLDAKGRPAREAAESIWARVAEALDLEPGEGEAPSTAAVNQVRAWVMAHRVDGVICPGCLQRAQVYRRTINSQMAVALIYLFRSYGMDFGFWPDVLAYANINRADEAKLAYWGLAEPKQGKREDGSNRTGYWKVTERGRSWLLEQLAVPRYALVYNGECIGLDHTELWTVRQALGTRANYDALMASAA